MSTRQADVIYDDIYRRIAEGQLKPHSRVVERDLGRDFECSRVPAREAIQRLHQEGLLEARAGWGSYVRHLSRDEWEQALRVRSVLEGLAFAIVAVACEKELQEGIRGVGELTPNRQAPIPIVIIPLSKDGCVDTEVDVELALEKISLGCKLPV